MFNSQVLSFRKFFHLAEIQKIEHCVKVKPIQDAYIF